MFDKDYILKRERARLESIIDNKGLPDVYDSFRDYLFDFYPDFSWNGDSKVELQWLLDDADWRNLAGEIKYKYGFDFVDEIKQAITEE